MNKINVEKVIDYSNILKENERLNNIINNLEEYSKKEIEYWEKEYKNSDHYDQVNILGYITALKNILNKIKELKVVELTENDKKQVKWLKEEFKVGVDKE